MWITKSKTYVGKTLVLPSIVKIFKERPKQHSRHGYWVTVDNSTGKIVEHGLEVSEEMLKIFNIELNEGDCKEVYMYEKC